MTLAHDDPRHGTRHGYNLGCHCDDCRAAKREYDQRWRRKTMSVPARAARWQAQKRRWWRDNRAKVPVQVRVTP